jgi:mono/diheme cytochrome c family protein
MKASSSILLLLLGIALPLPAAPMEFNRDIRPVLAENCFHCHGPDPGTRKAGLRLDTEAGFFTAKEGEKPTVIKGKPMDSALFLRLITADPDELMPPPETHKTLKPAEIAAVKSWIEQGAPWQPHWSLIAPTRPALPSVAAKQWVKTPVDAFVLQKLEAEGLSPAPGAEAHTLVRRIALDITGLPPSPEIIQKYATTKLSDAQISHIFDDLM